MLPIKQTLILCGQIPGYGVHLSNSAAREAGAARKAHISKDQDLYHWVTGTQAIGMPKSMDCKEAGLHTIPHYRGHVGQVGGVDCESTIPDES